MKVFLKILFYISFVFLFIYLYTKELLVIPDFRQPLWFIASLMLVFIGFILESKAWQIIAKQDIPKVSYKDSFTSNGKYVLSKYIPGKVWIIVGKAGYLKEKYKRSVINLTSFSFYLQLISLFAASIIGVFLVFYVDKNIFWGLVVLLIIFFAFFTVLHKPTLKIFSRILNYITKKEVRFPEAPTKISLRVFGISLANWIVWTLGFYLFLLSILPKDSVLLTMGVLFPVSSVIGIIVLIAPGGLGIREGFLVIGLTHMGIETQEATAVAFISRLWFLIGEGLFFGSSLMMDIKKR